jgi:hypothetical protein
MAISGSSDYSVNRDEIISHAYRIIGALRAGGTPSADDITDANTALNIMLKAWQAYGLQLWVIKEATIIPVKGQSRYLLGSAATDDHISQDMNKTEVRIDAATSDTILEVVTTTGMIVADNIGIVLDDGTTHWTTIASITDVDTVVITTGLPSAAAIDRPIYWYTTKIVRPNELLELYRRNYDDVVDVPLIRLSRTDFFTLSDKDTEGTPVNFYYNPQLGSSILNVWPVAGDIFSANSVFIANIKKPFDDMDSATDDFEFPQEWFEAIVYGLAERLAPMVGYPIQDRQLLKVEAREYLDLALSFDHEQTDVTFVIDTSQQQNLFGS